MSKSKHNNTDYLRMPVQQKFRILNMGNRILVASDPLLRPVVKGVRKTVKYLRYKTGKKFNKSRKYRR